MTYQSSSDLLDPLLGPDKHFDLCSTFAFGMDIVIVLFFGRLLLYPRAEATEVRSRR